MGSKTEVFSVYHVKKPHEHDWHAIFWPSHTVQCLVQCLEQCFGVGQMWCGDGSHRYGLIWYLLIWFFQGKYLHLNHGSDTAGIGLKTWLISATPWGLDHGAKKPCDSCAPARCLTGIELSPNPQIYPNLTSIPPKYETSPFHGHQFLVSSPTFPHFGCRWSVAARGTRVAGFPAGHGWVRTAEGNTSMSRAVFGSARLSWSPICVYKCDSSRKLIYKCGMFHCFHMC